MSEQARAYAEGFRDARAACHAIALQWIDGDSQCDGTVSRIADDIERLPGPAPLKPGAEIMTGLCTDKAPCAIATELRRALSDAAKQIDELKGGLIEQTVRADEAELRHQSGKKSERCATGCYNLTPGATLCQVCGGDFWHAIGKKS